MLHQKVINLPEVSSESQEVNRENLRQEFIMQHHLEVLASQVKDVMGIAQFDSFRQDFSILLLRESGHDTVAR